jgi:hypothetical protein
LDLGKLQDTSLNESVAQDHTRADGTMNKAALTKHEIYNKPAADGSKRPPAFREGGQYCERLNPQLKI